VLSAEYMGLDILTDQQVGSFAQFNTGMPNAFKTCTDFNMSQKVVY